MVDQVSPNRKKCGHVSDAQKQMLITFIENDSELRTGKFTNSFTYKESQKRWKYIAEQLNSSPGTKKDWSSWRRTWQDLKRNTRKKSADLNKYKMGTGGGPAPKELDDNEATILNVIDTSTINGNELVEESTIIIDHDYWTDNLVNDNKIIIKDVQGPSTSNTEENLNEENIENSSQNNSSSEKKRKRRISSTRLSETVKASKNIQEMMFNKSEKDEKYRVEKLDLLKKDVFARERIASALERLVEKFC